MPFLRSIHPSPRHLPNIYYPSPSYQSYTCPFLSIQSSSSIIHLSNCPFQLTIHPSQTQIYFSSSTHPLFQSASFQSFIHLPTYSFPFIPSTPFHLFTHLALFSTFFSLFTHPSLLLSTPLCLAPTSEAAKGQQKDYWDLGAEGVGLKVLMALTSSWFPHLCTEAWLTTSRPVHLTPCCGSYKPSTLALSIQTLLKTHQCPSMTPF